MTAECVFRSERHISERTGCDEWLHADSVQSPWPNRATPSSPTQTLHSTNPILIHVLSLSRVRTHIYTHTHQKPGSEQGSDWTEAMCVSSPSPEFPVGRGPS